MTVWKCASCGAELPGNRRSDMRYCVVRCRVRACRNRKGEGQHVRPTKKHGHTALKAALGAVAAGTAAAVAVDLVRKSQDARLEEQARKIADLEAQLQRAQAEKEESRRVQEGLRKQVEQLTREKKEVEEQLCESRDALEMEQAFLQGFRSAVDRGLLDRFLTEQRLLDESREQAALASLEFQRAEEYRRQLSESDERIHALLEHTDELTRQLSVATDSQVVQLAEWSASQRHLQLQSRLDNAEAESQRLKQQLRSVERELFFVMKKLAAKEQQKQLPPARQTEPTSSAQTALAVAN